MEKKKLFTTKMLVEGGIMIALAMALSYVKVYELPNGGSVTAGSMVPILLYAYRWGGARGALVGAVYGTLQFIFGPKWSFHIVSILGDYIAAFACLGVAGAFGKGVIRANIGIVIGICLRWACHVVSGAVVFASYAPPGQNPWIYSFGYNQTYMVPEMIISVVAFSILFKPVERIATAPKTI